MKITSARCSYRVHLHYNYGTTFTTSSSARTTAVAASESRWDSPSWPHQPGEAMVLSGSTNTEDYDFPFSLDKGLAAAGIAARVTELLSLDALWTSCARRNKPEDLKELGSVVDKMDSLLVHLS